MAFVHSLNTRLLFDDHHLSGYATSASEEYSGEVNESTVFTNTAKTYIAGLSDGSVSIEGLFDSATDAIHDAFRVLKATHSPVPLSYGPEGLAVGDPVELASVIRGSYSVPASVAGITQVSMSGQADGGVESGISLLDHASRTSSGDGSSHDSGSSSSDGAVAHLHVTAVSGSSPTLDVTVQHSSDGSTWADLITFDQATTTDSQRKTVTGTVDQHLRVTWTIGGTDPSFDFAVTFARR